MSDVARFWADVRKLGDGPYDCWDWTGTQTHGYGRFRTGERNVRAHRFAYELLVGPIPDGLTIDHLCRNTLCVNPAHLEAVTDRENILRGGGPPAENARKTHCKHGHEFTPENTYIYVDTGHRLCKECGRQADRARRPRRVKAPIGSIEEGE